MPIKSYLGKTFGGSARHPLGIRRVKTFRYFQLILFLTARFCPLFSLLQKTWEQQANETFMVSDRSCKYNVRLLVK